MTLEDAQLKELSEEMGDMLKNDGVFFTIARQEVEHIRTIIGEVLAIRKDNKFSRADGKRGAINVGRCMVAGTMNAHPTANKCPNCKKHICMDHLHGHQCEDGTTIEIRFAIPLMGGVR